MSSIKRQTTGFFDLPAEIRTQIYTYVIDRVPYDTGCEIVRVFKTLARSKSRLLRVNKLIYSEALPLFYRFHRFCLGIQSLFSPRPRQILAAESRFDLLLHLDLVYEDWIELLDTPVSDATISNHLRFIQVRCPNLKSLRLELRSKYQTHSFVHNHYRGYRVPTYRTIPPVSVNINPLIPFNMLPHGTPIVRHMPGMTVQFGVPLVSRHHVPRAAPRLSVAAESANVMPRMTPIPTMPPGLRMMPGTNLSQRITPRGNPSPPSPPLRLGQQRNQSSRPYFIDKDGASVQSLKEIWKRLDNLTIVIPEMGDFGEPGFQRHMCKHLVEVVVPDFKWKLRSVCYEGENTSLQGARLVQWSVVKGPNC